MCILCTHVPVVTPRSSGNSETFFFLLVFCFFSRLSPALFSMVSGKEAATRRMGKGGVLANQTYRILLVACPDSLLPHSAASHSAQEVTCFSSHRLPQKRIVYRY